MNWKKWKRGFNVHFKSLGLILGELKLVQCAVRRVVKCKAAVIGIGTRSSAFWEWHYTARGRMLVLVESKKKKTPCAKSDRASPTGSRIVVWYL